MNDVFPVLTNQKVGLMLGNSQKNLVLDVQQDQLDKGRVTVGGKEIRVVRCGQGYETAWYGRVPNEEGAG